MKTSEELRKKFTNETGEDWHEDEAVSINPEYLNWLETKVGQNETNINLLKKLQEYYMIDCNEEGDPNADPLNVMHTWVEVERAIEEN